MTDHFGKVREDNLQYGTSLPGFVVAIAIEFNMAGITNTTAAAAAEAYAAASNIVLQSCDSSATKPGAAHSLPSRAVLNSGPESRLPKPTARVKNVTTSSKGSNSKRR